MSDETVAACPACDDSSIVIIGQTSIANGTQRYRCTACGETFTDPHEREAYASRDARKGLAKELADYEPGTCRECGCDLGAGYLCDDCDTVEGWDDA